jgi:hypothetical protein
MQRRLPGFDQPPKEVPNGAKGRTRPFDPTYAGQTKARDHHTCDLCGRPIAPGEIYYQEGKERFLGALHGREICLDCYRAPATAS